MQIHNIMILIFITCAVINHLFVFHALVCLLCIVSFCFFVVFFLMIQALFKVNNFNMINNKTY